MEISDKTVSQFSRRAFHCLVLMTISGRLVLGDRSARVLANSPTVSLQPLAEQVKRLLNALQLIGEPLSQDEVVALNAAFATADENQAAEQIQKILDQHVLINVEINPESRVSASRGQAKAQLIEQGWRSFLIKIRNQAGDTSAFKIYCPQARPMGRRSDNTIVGIQDFTNGAVDVTEARDRWAAINIWEKPPLQPTLSGLEIEYRILQIYSRDRGQGLGNRLLVSDLVSNTSGTIHCRERLGGMLNYYYRAAA